MDWAAIPSVHARLNTAAAEWWQPGLVCRPGRGESTLCLQHEASILSTWPSREGETGERVPPVTGRPVKGSLLWQGHWWKGPSADRETSEKGPPVTRNWWKGPSSNREMVKGAKAGGHSHNQGKQSRFTQNPHYGRCSPQPVLHLLHKTTWVATSVFHCKCVLGNLTADRNSHHALWLTKQCNIM